jgi:hypothetical protein
VHGPTLGECGQIGALSTCNVRRRSA